MDFNRKSFESMKNLGNEIFKKLYKDEKLSPEIFKQRMALALVFYNKAMKLAKSPQEKSSIQKNIAMTQLLIAKKFIKRKRHLLVSRLRSAKKIEEAAAETKEIKFYLEESMETFDEAVESGELAQPLKWMAHVTGKQEECADLLWDFLLSSDDRNNLKVLFGKLHQLCLTKIGAVRARLFLKLGRFTFQMAIAFQEKGKVVESLQLLRDNNFNIEEAKKLEAQMEEALELEDSTYLHICIGESAKFRQIGDKLWEEATLEEEDINMELVWDAVDNYVQSIVSSRGKCIESEAISHSHLGRLYEILILNAKSREHFRSAIDLGLSMHPKTFNDQKWYKQAVAGLDKFQKQEQYKENKEKERIRAPIREELKNELNELKKASEKSAEALIEAIYSKHPPKRGQKSTSSTLKTVLKKALLHYHPDKQDLDKHGLKWIVLSEDITVMLNHHFGQMKGV